MLYLPVEIKTREMHGKLLLAYYALLNGTNVIIGEHSKVEEAALKYPAGVFLCKGYPRGYMKRVIVAAKEAGHYVVNLDEEGLIYHDSEVYLKTRMNRKFMPYHDHVFCWGENQQKMIERAYPEMKGKCTSTGNPRFDLLTPKYREVYREESEKLGKIYGPYILVNTRFTLYNTIKGKREERLTKHGEYIRDLYHHFIHMIKRMSQEFPKVTFIIRPHPAERKESYVGDLKGHSNVQVRSEGSVIHWLMGAEALIHNGCTTGIEGYLLGQPVFSYEPIISPPFDVSLTQDVSKRASGVEELSEELKLLMERGEGLPVSCPERLSHHYVNAKGEEYAYRRILQHMESVKLETITSIRPIRHRYQKDRRKKILHLFPSFTEKEIRQFFDKIDQIEREELQVNYYSLADRLFLLTPEGRK